MALTLDILRWITGMQLTLMRTFLFETPAGILSVPTHCPGPQTCFEALLWFVLLEELTNFHPNRDG